MLYPTDNYHVTECDECHVVTTCVELDEPDGGNWDVCRNCYRKLVNSGLIEVDND